MATSSRRLARDRSPDTASGSDVQNRESRTRLLESTEEPLWPWPRAASWLAPSPRSHPVAYCASAAGSGHLLAPRAPLEPRRWEDRPGRGERLPFARFRHTFRLPAQAPKIAWPFTMSTVVVVVVADGAGGLAGGRPCSGPGPGGGRRAQTSRALGSAGRFRVSGPVARPRCTRRSSGGDTGGPRGT